MDIESFANSRVGSTGGIWSIALWKEEITFVTMTFACTGRLLTFVFALYKSDRPL